MPPSDTGVARATIALDETRAYRVQMAAYNDLGESVRSNQIAIEASAPTCDVLLCDDRNSCTSDSCDAAGCFNKPLQDGTQCDDGYLDTVDDQCIQGVCEGIRLGCRDAADCDDPLNPVSTRVIATVKPSSPTASSAA